MSRRIPFTTVFFGSRNEVAVELHVVIVRICDELADICARGAFSGEQLAGGASQAAVGATPASRTSRETKRSPRRTNRRGDPSMFTFDKSSSLRYSGRIGAD
jgi:hypothetical protein